jgi:hypothetical protein
LVLLSLLFDLSVLLLPLGLALALIGVWILSWGVAGEVLAGDNALGVIVHKKSPSTCFWATMPQARAWWRPWHRQWLCLRFERTWQVTKAECADCPCWTPKARRW